MSKRLTRNRVSRRWGLVLACLLPGCASVRPNLGADKEIVVYPRFDRASQAILNPNTISSIATLDIVPYVEVTAGSYSPISSLTGNVTTVGAADMLKLSQASPSIDPNRPFIIKKLKPNKNYRVWARAYNSSNALISQDSTSYVDVAVGNNDAPAMAQLPVNLADIPFGASILVDINHDGRYDNLKSTLYLVAGGGQLAIAQTTRSYPQLSFGNLQGNTSYRLVAEAYKLGSMMASNSLDINITNDTSPATGTLSLTIPYVVSTLAGSGSVGMQDGIGTQTTFNNIRGVAVDTWGNVYLADRDNNCIRKVTAAGVVTTLAGNGSADYVDGAGTAARFKMPYGVAVDSQGNVFVGDYGNNRIRKITAAGLVTTFAGSGSVGYLDANGTSAMFNRPLGMTVDSFDNVYVGDYDGQRIRKITPNGDVTTIAGSGGTGYSEGQGTNAVFHGPVIAAPDRQGNLYVMDYSNYAVRKISTTGVVSTLAGGCGSGYADGTGTAAKFNLAWGVAVDLWGNLYIGDAQNQRVRKITATGVVTTIAGNSATGGTNGVGTAATFNQPCGVAVDERGNIYVGDGIGHRLRKLQ